MAESPAGSSERVLETSAAVTCAARTAIQAVGVTHASPWMAGGFRVSTITPLHATGVVISPCTKA